MSDYRFAEIESKWQRIWADQRVHEAGRGTTDTARGATDMARDTVGPGDRPPFSVIPMFPYPSGKLHMGHVRNYTIGDVVARYRRRRGYDVLHVMGWDAYGLAAENEAIHKGIHPRDSIARNIRVMKGQLQQIGISYDWTRELATCDEDFDHWNQWLFLRMWKAGLAYRGKAPVNWCPSCLTTLANEQVAEGRCERCGATVETRELEQWFFRTTAYAGRLADDLGRLDDWPERIKRMQANWIGRREDGTFHIRDWLISRQRYWGSPFPVIYCDHCGMVPVPEEQLPVKLPPDVDFRPKGTSPLAACEEWVNVQCPSCGRPARRETDTMDTFVCSAWYYLRYTNPRYGDGPFDPRAVGRWMPIDLYIGGPDHATVHLIYTRFFMKALADQGLITFDEPIKKLFVQGVVTQGGARMSKSKGNATSQDEVVEKYGADTVRVYTLFVAPPDQDVEWSNRGIEGIHRCLRRVWRLVESVGGGPAGEAGVEPVGEAGVEATGVEAIDRAIHRTIKSVTDDIEAFKYNTAVSTLMGLASQIAAATDSLARRKGVEVLVSLLSPFAPHLAEEAWERLGHSGGLSREPWPEWDPDLASFSEVTVSIQVNGRVRDTMEVPVDATEDELRRRALERPRIRQAIGGKRVSRVVVVPGKTISLVTD